MEFEHVDFWGVADLSLFLTFDLFVTLVTGNLKFVFLLNELAWSWTHVNLVRFKVGVFDWNHLLHIILARSKVFEMAVSDRYPLLDRICLLHVNLVRGEMRVFDDLVFIHRNDFFLGLRYHLRLRHFGFLFPATLSTDASTGPEVRADVHQEYDEADRDINPAHCVSGLKALHVISLAAEIDADDEHHKLIEQVECPLCAVLPEILSTTHHDVYYGAHVDEIELQQDVITSEYKHDA